MDFATLALISLVGVLGPLLALPRRWNLPVVLGELVAGIALGRTGFDVLHAGNGTFTFLADIGFALIMFVAGSHVPVRDPNLRAGLRLGALRAMAVGAVSVVLAIGIAHGFGTRAPGALCGADRVVVGRTRPADRRLAGPER